MASDLSEHIQTTPLRDTHEHLDTAAASRLTRDNQYDCFRVEVRRESAAAADGRTGGG